MSHFDVVRKYIIHHKRVSYFLLAAVVYLAATFFYMGGALTNSSQTLLSFPGDNTAGMIALFSVDSHDPWYGRSDVFSYPYGELLGQPTHITAQAVFIPFWILAKLFGPVSSFNLLMAIGFMATALTMFAFIRWLLKGREPIAIIAGFAAAFTPYIQTTSGVHISYIFGAVFIAAIWLFLLFWKDPTWKKVAGLGAIAALFAYIDGYFILLGGVVLASLIVGAVGFDILTAKGHKPSSELIRRVKMLAVAAVAAGICMLPILYVQAQSASQINSLLAESRDSIQREAQVYGARPLEYLLPNAMNPLTSDIFGTFSERDTHGSNTSESIISLSLVLLALAVFFVASVIWTKKRGKQILTNAQFGAPFIATIFGVIFLAALLLSFPPKLGPIPTPSYLLIETIQLWRVLARLSLIVNIAMVVLAACGLALLLQRVKSNGRRVALCLLVIVVVFLEYLTFTPPRQTEGYEQVPEMYSWLKTQQSYNEIAEYPLDELGQSDYPVFYNTYQRVHGKKLLNGIVKEKKPYFTRLAVADLKSPQSVPGLRALGIDFITIHAPTFPGDIDGLRFVHQSAEKKLTTNGKPNKVWGYAVEPGPQTTYLAAATEGFHAPQKESPIQTTQIMGSRGVFGVMKVGNGKDANAVQILLHAQALDKVGQAVRVVQNNQEVWRGTVPAEGMDITFSVDPRSDFVLEAVDPKVDPTLKLPEITVVQ